jgi:hypothetical protein
MLHDEVACFTYDEVYTTMHVQFDVDRCWQGQRTIKPTRFKAERDGTIVITATHLIPFKRFPVHSPKDGPVRFHKKYYNSTPHSVPFMPHPLVRTHPRHYPAYHIPLNPHLPFIYFDLKISCKWYLNLFWSGPGNGWIPIDFPIDLYFYSPRAAAEGNAFSFPIAVSSSKKLGRPRIRSH